jgi:hypothetical protein
LHGFANTGLGRGRHQQMHVVGHQHVGVNVALVSGCRGLKFLQIEAVVGIGAKYHVPIVAPLNDVLRLPGKHKSWQSGHVLFPTQIDERQLNRSRQHNQSSLSLLVPIGSLQDQSSLTPLIHWIPVALMLGPAETRLIAPTARSNSLETGMLGPSEQPATSIESDPID